MCAFRLSPDYEREFLRLLEAIEESPRITPRALSLFWPKIGRLFEGETLLVGRAVNGWLDRWDLDDNADLRVLAETARRTAEAEVAGCPMGWVLDRWKRGGDEYDTSRSQFWVTARHISLGTDGSRTSDWPSHLAWTNLAKISRWGKGNPPWRLRQQQLSPATRLLEREVTELHPRRIVVLAGRAWFEPYATALGLNVQWRDGLVEGIAGDKAGRRWVVAVHPMTRSPRAVAEAVLDAFAADS
jgi:hypothetical protein